MPSTNVPEPWQVVMSAARQVLSRNTMTTFVVLPNGAVMLFGAGALKTTGLRRAPPRMSSARISSVMLSLLEVPASNPAVVLKYLYPEPLTANVAVAGPRTFWLKKAG